LHRAAKEGNVEECRKLLSTINVNSIDSKGWTALHAAAATNQIPIFGLLLEAGANINTFNVNGESPLVLAIDSGHIDAVLALHNAGADVNASHKNGFSPMCMAARKGVEMVNLLLALKASPSLVDAGGWTPFFFAIQDDTAIQTLLQHGADPNISASGLDPPLYHAIESGTLETVRVLLDGGATSNVIFKNGWTPMMVAAKMGDHEVGRLLQANGAGLNDTTADKLTPLHIAAMNSRRIFFKWLVEAGANEDAQDAHGRTA
ncbi:ankyrin, partial [Lojkania enalia]